MLVDKKLIIEAKDKMGADAAILIAKDLEIEKWDEKELKGCCPFHKEDSPSLIWNPKDNCFKCFGCGKNYGILDHYMSYNKLSYIDSIKNLFEITSTNFNFGEFGLSKKKDYKYPQYTPSPDRSKVNDYFALRAISKETLDYCDVQQSLDGLVMWNFYDENDILLTVKCRNARKVDEHERKEWYLPNFDNTPILFNMNRIDPTMPLVITEGQCFPPETEILTENGWVKFVDYNNEKVLAVNPDMTGEYVTPSAKIIKDYDGDMYNLKAINYSTSMTADHNVVYFDRNNNIQKRKMSDMPDTLSNSHIPVAINHNGTGIPLKNCEIALFIAVSADGSLSQRHNGNIYVRISFKKQRKVERLEKILNECNIEYHKGIYESGFTCFCFTAPSWLKTKRFDHNWIAQSTFEQKRFIIDEMVYWDGNFVPNRKQVEFSSNVYENSTFIQTIAHLCGYMSNIIIRPKGDYKPIFKVSVLFSKKDVSWQSVYKNNKLTKNHYVGKVYCVTVPTGMIMTRHNNHITVSGNCDTLAVIESGWSNVVSVPGGTENMKWIETCYDWLEQFDKIILWSDNDLPGQKMRKEACSRLGTWRCFYVDLPEKLKKGEKTKSVKDANEVLYSFGKETVIELINNAQEIPVLNIVDLSEVDDFDIETAPGLYSGIKLVDDIIYKFIFGSVVILTGMKGCVDCDTEFFNGKTWKPISQYSKDDMVLQYNKDGSSNLVMPTEYHKYPAEFLWHFHTERGIDQCLSDEHEMVYWTTKGNLGKKKFKDFRENYLMHGFSGTIPSVFSFSGTGIEYDENTIRLFVASICDGSYYYHIKDQTSKSYNRCRFHLKGEVKKKRIWELMEKSPYPHRQKISANEGYVDFYIDLPIRIKEFDESWYNCTQEQLAIICDECLYWDGSTRSNRRSFSTTIKTNADFIQFAFTACKCTTNIGIADRRGRTRTLNGKEYTTKSIDYTLTISDRQDLCICPSYDPALRKDFIKPYKTIDGFKYCFTVDSGMLILRRNNRIFVTGNSGKSSILNQMFICEPLNQGHDVFIFSGELSTPILKNWIETTMAGKEKITMKNKFVRVIEPQVKKDMRSWYKGRVFAYDDLNNNADQILDRAISTTRRFGTKVWILDNLMTLDIGANNDNDIWQKQKQFIVKLVSLAIAYQVLIVLVAHPRKTSEIRRLVADDVAGSNDLGNLAQYIVGVHRFTREEKEGIKDNKGNFKKGKEPIDEDTSIDIFKNRMTGRVGDSKVFFDYNSMRFYSNAEELYKRYKWNKDTKPIPKTLPDRKKETPYD